jgi:hypothetical protein
MCLNGHSFLVNVSQWSQFLGERVHCLPAIVDKVFWVILVGVKEHKHGGLGEIVDARVVELGVGARGVEGRGAGDVPGTEGRPPHQHPRQEHPPRSEAVLPAGVPATRGEIRGSPILSDCIKQVNVAADT